MPRLARTVFAGVPHHTTQEGNRHEAVFIYVAEDYQTGLEWLSHYSQQRQLETLAYSQMTNHVHLVVVSSHESSLQYVLKPLYMRYVQGINRMRKWRDHFWQGRYFSLPMDKRYMWSAMTFGAYQNFSVK